MGREKLVDICFVFRIWEFEVNYGDCVCVPCILYVDLVENFKLAVNIQIWLSKLHMLATGRLYHAIFLSNSTFPLCLHTLLLSELKSADLWVLLCHVPGCRTYAQCLFDQTYESRRKNHSALGKASK